MDHEWWEFVYDDWVTKLRTEHNFDTTPAAMHFSGFWCQGDGASFTGSVIDVPKFLDEHMQDTSPMMRKLYDQTEGLYLRITSTCSRSCHENTVRGEIDTERLEAPSDDDFGESVLAAWEDALEAELRAAEELLTETYRKLMRDFYSDLESEYNHRTSDESVWEWIEDNVEVGDEEVIELIADECDND